MARRRYIHVFPPVDHYMEAYCCYKSASKRLKWLSAETWETWSSTREEWKDPSVGVLFWSYISSRHILGMIPSSKAAGVALRYSESLGEPGRIDSGLYGVFRDFWGCLKVFDAVFTGSLSAARILQPYCRKIAMEPIGYEPGVMGVPDWSRPKKRDLVFYGAPYGRREWILPALAERFGDRFSVLPTGTYGVERKRACDESRAILHAGHSEETAIPGFRIWQAVSTSSALIAECQEGWPAVPGKHFVSVPAARKDRIEPFLDRIDWALKLPLEKIARAAHADLSSWTLEKAMMMVSRVF